MKYVLLFIVIQVIAFLLAIVGLPICAVLAAGGCALVDPNTSLYHWPKWAWLWDNDEDGVYPHWYCVANPTWSPRRTMFVWTALRNSVNNFRYVRGVSKPGRPLWHRTWTMRGKQFYAKAGWEAKTGWPSLSAGAGRGF